MKYQFKHCRYTVPKVEGPVQKSNILTNLVDSRTFSVVHEVKLCVCMCVCACVRVPVMGMPNGGHKIPGSNTLGLEKRLL